jgi:hypothetical protein
VTRGVCEKVAQIVAQPIFGFFVHWEKVRQTFAPLLYFSKKTLSKENYHPIGENSPNLVTLLFVALF